MVHLELGLFLTPICLSLGQDYTGLIIVLLWPTLNSDSVNSPNLFYFKIPFPPLGPLHFHFIRINYH